KMVLTNPTRFNEIYKLLKNDSIQGETVLVLVARDCDSIAACKIFTDILKSDLISFNIKPVAGLDDLIDVNNTLMLDNEELKTIVMINCGGNIDIESLLTNLNENQLVYIIDSHRPYHRSNVDNQNHVIIIDDGSFMEEQIDEEDDDELQDEEDLDDDEEEDLDDEDDEEEDEVDDEEQDKEPEDDDYDGEAVIDENSEGKRKRSDKRKKLKRKKDNTPVKERRRRAAAARSHSRKSRTTQSYYGKSSASMMYQLSTILSKDSLDGLLWYAILGVTDQLVHERVPLLNYDIEYKMLKALVLNAYDPNDKSGQGDHITVAEDYRFMLYRHWNLYESMYHSKYVSCVLRLWRAKGKYLLETLFALMGLPLEQVKQKYVSMSGHYKTNLKAQLATHAPKFGLNEIYYRSFVRKYECSIELSASDMVHALTALMESDNLESDVTDKEIWEQNFWDAYDALSNRNLDLLVEGLKQAIYLQKEITRQLFSVIEKKIVVMSGPFRYALLPEGSDTRLFVHPMALTKLGLYIMDAYATMKKKTKPFLVGALNENTGNYLLVGISSSHGSSSKQANVFGVNFLKVASSTNSLLKYQSFDTAVVEIEKLDMPKFIENLHASLVSPSSQGQE
ncbi:hypothetical protein SAMD00019534_052670, partial [Acytostelium subglobosum LB1]|uniref:hypothetical protein n=1 Tax=Acytostelium subglobosum LB1 TaxID=1410327 RepID=UPI000644C05F